MNLNIASNFIDDVTVLNAYTVTSDVTYLVLKDNRLRIVKTVEESKQTTPLQIIEHIKTLIQNGQFLNRENVVVQMDLSKIDQFLQKFVPLNKGTNLGPMVDLHTKVNGLIEEIKKKALPGSVRPPVGKAPQPTTVPLSRQESLTQKQAPASPKMLRQNLDDVEAREMKRLGMNKTMNRIMTATDKSIDPNFFTTVKNSEYEEMLKDLAKNSDKIKTNRFDLIKNQIYNWCRLDKDLVTLFNKPPFSHLPKTQEEANAISKKQDPAALENFHKIKQSILINLRNNYDLQIDVLFVMGNKKQIPSQEALGELLKGGFYLIKNAYEQAKSKGSIAEFFNKAFNDGPCCFDMRYELLTMYSIGC